MAKSSSSSIRSLLLAAILFMCVNTSTSNSSLKEDFSLNGEHLAQMQHQYLFLKQWIQNETMKEAAMQGAARGMNMNVGRGARMQRIPVVDP
ncbi:hypothetical protein HK102_006823, partial [Quaeritorhiza haematococci]